MYNVQPSNIHLNSLLIILTIVLFFYQALGPLRSFWNVPKLQQNWHITDFDENQNIINENSLSDDNIAANQEPSVAVTSELVFPKYISDVTRKRNKFYLRRVACLGKNGEIAKTICCTDSHPKPWAILLPRKYKVKCYKPDCQHRCYSEIMKLRRKKYITEQPLSKYSYDYDEIKRKHIFNLKQTKACNKEVSTSLPKVAIPEAILELIDLCNFLNNSKLLQFEKLNSFCKIKNMDLEDFLKHVHYKDSTDYEVNGSNSKIHLESQEDGDIIEPISYEEMFPETTVSNIIQSSVGYGTCENKFKSNMETKTIGNNILAVKKKAFMPKSHDTNHQYSPSVSTLYNNELSYTEFTTQTIVAKSGLDIIMDSLLNFNKRFLGDNLRPVLTEKIVTNNDCYYCDDYDGIIEASSIMSKIDERNKIHDECCCNCVTKNISDSKEACIAKQKLAQFLQLLMHGPRPTFANKTKHLPHRTKQMLPYNNKNTTPMTKISSVLSYTVLKAENPSEIKSLVRSYKPKESIKHYVDYIDDICGNMYKEFKQAQWEYETNITHNTRQKSMASSLEFNQLLRAVKKELVGFTNVPLNDINLQRQIKLLALPGMDSLPEIKSDEFEQILYAMENIYSSAIVGQYNRQSEKVTLNPDITNIMAHSMDPYELMYYWIEWRKATGKQVKSLFEEYVSLMHLAAKLNGFHDASEMWTRQYESDDFIDMISVYWEGVKPLYLQLHTYVRHMLHDLYGDVAGAKDEGKIPAHLTGDIWSKDWKNLYSKVRPYNIKDYMTQPLKKSMTPQKITRNVENMFVSMGFTKLPNEFWDNSIFTKTENKLILCEPSSWDMGTGLDFRIKLCATNKMEDLFTIHNLVTLTEYYKEYKGLPFAFRNAANPAFSEAIAETIVLSAQTNDHLKLFVIPTKRSEKADINKLMRIALEKVAFIPYSYILILWRHKVFTGEINATNYNSEWWKLRSEYQGIYPPIERTEDDFDVGCKQHIVANQPYIKYFLSTILQFQFYEALCRQSDFQGPLHKCDVTSSAEAGKTLRNAMSMGSSQHWKDVMEVLTGTRKIDSKPLMRYFEPLMKWLQQQNKKRNLKIGWEE